MRDIQTQLTNVNITSLACFSRNYEQRQALLSITKFCNTPLIRVANVRAFIRLGMAVVILDSIQISCCRSHSCTLSLTDNGTVSATSTDGATITDTSTVFMLSGSSGASLCRGSLAGGLSSEFEPECSVAAAAPCCVAQLAQDWLCGQNVPCYS